MRVWKAALAVLFASLWAAAIAAPGPEKPAGDADITALLAPMRDFQAEVKVTKLDTGELEKIGRDFATTYRFRSLVLMYKNPDKLRLEGKSRVLGDALVILNGAKRRYSVPKLNIKRTETFDKDPARQQSLLEYGGLVSGDTLRFMRPTFVGPETLDGRKALVFDLRYQNCDSRSYHRCWIDPETRITRKRAWYGNDEKLKATFLYEGAKEVSSGLWLPGACEIRNAEGTPAAVLAFGEVKVNQGLPDALFAVAP